MAEGNPLGSGWAAAFDWQDRLHVTTIQGEIWRIDLDGRWTLMGRSPLGNPLFGMAVDPEGRVRVVNAEGVIGTVATGTHEGGLAVDGDGTLWLSDFVNRAVRKIGPDGAVADASGGEPFAVAACPNGTVAFTEPYRVQRIGPGSAEVIAGSLDRVFSGEDGLERNARFVTPLAVACDS